MAQKPIEIILMRQLASTLALPVFLVDATGTLVFYNEAAERLLGLRFDETGEMPPGEWGTRWEPTADDGSPIAPESLPLAVAIAQRRPAHGGFRIQGADGRRHRVEVSAVPLLTVPDRVLGAAAFFKEVSG